jgi:acetoin utilization protein AcuB
LVGIISDRDIRLACSSPFLGNSVEKDMDELAKHTVQECMNPIVMTIDDDATVVEAAKLIRVRGVGGLPVVNKNGDLVGMITRSDLIDHLIRVLAPYDPSKDAETTM